MSACCMLLQGLSRLQYEIVSTGGSAKAVEAAGGKVTRVEELTGFPEMLDGVVCPPLPFQPPAVPGSSS